MKQAAGKNRNLVYFEAAYPDLATWWHKNDFEFAVSLRTQAERKGTLTEGQISAARKCIASSAKRQANLLTNFGNSTKADDSGLLRALNAAKARGVGRPKIRCVIMDDVHSIQVEFKFAPENGVNAGSIYATVCGDYSARIKDGHIYPNDLCQQWYVDWIKEAMASIEEAAIRYGRVTGQCSCCGRALTNGLSIELGIGPICREKFFL